MSVDNFLFLAARTVRPEAFVSCFGALAVLLYLLSRRHDSLLLAILSGIALGLSFNYHVNGFVIALSLGLLLLAEFRLSIWRSKRAWALVLASAATPIPFCVWLAGDPVRWEAFRTLYGRGGVLRLQDIIRSEAVRYADLLGIGNQRLHFLPFPLPLRFHIVLLIAVSLGVLAWRRRFLFWTILALVVPSLLTWPMEVNPSARLFAITAPHLASAIALAFEAIDRPKWRMVCGCWLRLVTVSQLVGKLLLLRQSRMADYVTCSRRIRAAVPQGAHVYGAITFFMALHDLPYYSWNRTPLDIAVQKYGVTYSILNDRVLVYGSGLGLDDWKDIREAAERFVRTNAILIAKVPDPFYGDLESYRVKPNPLFGSAIPALFRHRPDESCRSSIDPCPAYEVPPVEGVPLFTARIR
jgi:4-amino-4-deoxy-L-arabinose transferase-like glycosyltransferase